MKKKVAVFFVLATSQAALSNPWDTTGIDVDGNQFSVEATSPEEDAFIPEEEMFLDGYEPSHAPSAELDPSLDSTSIWLSKVNETKRFKWTGRLTYEKNGSTHSCTGALIGPRHVLTSGHCVHEGGSSGRWFTGFKFTPAQNGSYKPYGSIGYRRAIAPKGHTRDDNRDYDYGMVILDEDIGYKVGYLGFGVHKSSENWLNTVAYPGSKPYGTMWRANCSVDYTTENRIFHECEVSGGSSGSPYYRYDSETGKRHVKGIHSGRRNGNAYAKRINSGSYRTIKNWRLDN